MESLQKVGLILELGLITGAWLDVRESGVESEVTENPCLEVADESIPECDMNSTEET